MGQVSTPDPLVWQLLWPCGALCLRQANILFFWWHTGCQALPTGIRHLGEPSRLQRSLGKMERETLWHIAHGLSVLLRKDFQAGVASYAAKSSGAFNLF